MNAIIKNYLETGEPVGSRTISKYTDLNLSSATIRNEMSDLEDLGYIVQPHTSAGRIPSDKGYRFYVDQLMAEKEQQIEEREREADEMKDMLELDGRFAYYAQLHGWTEMYNEHQRCFDFKSDENISNTFSNIFPNVNRNFFFFFVHS